MPVTLKKAKRHGDTVYIWCDTNGHGWEVYQSPDRKWRYIRDDHYASSIGHLTMEDARSALERAWLGTLDDPRARELPMEIDTEMAAARDVWLATRAAKAAEEARMLALRLAANARSRPLPMDGSDSHEYGEE